MLIDAHCHINTLTEGQQLDLTDKAKSDYIFIDISIDLDSALKSISLSKNYSFIYTSLGFHPIGCKEFREDIIDRYKNILKGNEKIIAIGEVGLDYKASLPLGEQERLLSEFIQLSKDFSLPLIIHNRWHNEMVLDILSERFSNYENIIFHCFSQDKDFLTKIVDKNGFVSFSLNILRGKKSIIEALRNVPLDNLLLETDSPYMRIEGNCSSPLDINKVYSYTAKERGVSASELSRIVYGNACRVFDLRA